MCLGRRQKTAFGEYLVEQIKAVNMSQEEFYTEVKIKKPYFYDLLTHTPPPEDLQNRMLAVLESRSGEDIKRRNTFYNLAAAGRNEIPADIAKVIFDNQSKFDEIRKVLSDLLNAHQ